jgi:hypothetical protein
MYVNDVWARIPFDGLVIDFEIVPDSDLQMVDLVEI